MFYHCHTFYVLFRFFYYIYCSMKPHIYVFYQFNNQRNQIPQRQIGIQFLWEGKLWKKRLLTKHDKRKCAKHEIQQNSIFFLNFDPIEWNTGIGFAIFFVLPTHSILTLYKLCIQINQKLNDHFSRLIWSFIP